MKGGLGAERELEYDVRTTPINKITKESVFGGEYVSVIKLWRAVTEGVLVPINKILKGR